MSFSDTLSNIYNPLSTEEERQAAMDQAKDDLTYKKPSIIANVVGGAVGSLGGYGAGHLLGRLIAKPTSERVSTYANNKLDAYMTKKLGAKIPWEKFTENQADFDEALKMLNEYLATKGPVARAVGEKATRMTGSLFAGMADGPKSYIKHAYEDFVPMVMGGLGVVPGASAASGFLDKRLGTSQISPDVEEDLRRFKEDPASRAALTDRLKLYKNLVDESKGSGAMQALTALGVGIPLSLFYSAPKLHAWMKKKIPNESLKNSYMFSSPLGRDMVTENIGDLAVASPIAAGAGLAAYNMTSGENPYGQ